MADAATSIVVLSTKKAFVVHLTNLSDGTGEANVVKVDKSTLLAAPTRPGLAAAEPLSVDIISIGWRMQGMDYVKLSWDHTTDDTAMILTGSGYEDFSGRDGAYQDINSTAGLKDPRSAGGPGDILLTTGGATSGGSYDITLACVLTNF